jgi:hypothetical protein
MSISSIKYHLLHGPHSGFIILLVFGILGMIYACFTDVFIDGSESGFTAEGIANRGLKATKITRPIMMVLYLSIAGFALWKMWQP